MAVAANHEKQIGIIIEMKIGSSVKWRQQQRNIVSGMRAAASSVINGRSVIISVTRNGVKHRRKNNRHHNEEII